MPGQCPMGQASITVPVLSSDLSQCTAGAEPPIPSSKGMPSGLFVRSALGDSEQGTVTMAWKSWKIPDGSTANAPPKFRVNKR